ncbi:MAG: hypothetical protein ACREDM_06195 [Methylocella sp.]
MAACPAPSELVEDCPARGTGAALVMPAAGVEAMNKHLAEISQCASVRAIAPPILDGAGWHDSPQLIVPGNIVLMPLPPHAPELNSVDPSAAPRASRTFDALRLGHFASIRAAIIPATASGTPTRPSSTRVAAPGKP